MEEITKAWQRPWAVVNCGHCDWTYLMEPGEPPAHCPHCYDQPLTPLEEKAFVEVFKPERILPFQVANEQVENNLKSFSRSFWLPPKDLKYGQLAERLRRVFVPVWLVDSDVEAIWQAEMGFNYQVVSHQERYLNHEWITQVVHETKVRWEPRAGLLNRHYDNVAAPALEEIAALQRKLGEFEHAQAEDYNPAVLDGALVRWPNRDPLDAWPDAQIRIQSLATAECQAASGANHLRQYGWQPRFSGQHWTLLLLPIYSTFYLDDDQQPLPILLNGRSGQLSGIRKASMRRAKRYTRNLAILAILAFLTTIFLLFLDLNLAVITGFLTVLLGLGAIAPIAQVSRFNRSQSFEIPFVRN